MVDVRLMPQSRATVHPEAGLCYRTVANAGHCGAPTMPIVSIALWNCFIADAIIEREPHEQGVNKSVA